jgi:protein involved in polysaccharide export with SLBB domain
MKLSNPTILLLAIFGIGTASLSAQDAALRIGDSLELRLGGVPSGDISQITGSYVVDNSGCINLAYVNKISVAGKTAAQAADSIEAAYKGGEIFTNPTITISTQGQGRFVNVGGEVKSPNRIVFTPDLTLMTAINAAGGMSEFANAKKVRLIRGKEVMIIDTKKILSDPSLDIAVKPGDQIFVEQSWL